jgi:hypothetical protein
VGDGPDGHRYEAQVGRRPVRRRLRGRLEEIQRHRRSQNTSGKLDRFIDFILFINDSLWLQVRIYT